LSANTPPAKLVSFKWKIHGEVSKGDVVRMPEDTSRYIDIDREGLCTATVDSLENTPTEFDWGEVVGCKEFPPD